MLQKQTTHPELIRILELLMAMPLLSHFRLVGGTALSLMKGHRISVDIDLFTDRQYGTTDFSSIEAEIKKSFPVVENPDDEFPALKARQNNNGLHLTIGFDEEHLVKTDILYWEDFLFEQVEVEGIRMASIEEIGTMKLDVISRGGRKKDFWDLFEILEDYSLEYLLDLYQMKYPYYDVEDVKKGLMNFTHAEEMPDPICLKRRTWEVIKHKIAGEATRLST